MKSFNFRGSEHYVRFSDFEEEEIVLEEVDRYEFWFNYYNANFEHYLEWDLVYMVSLTRNPEYAQYGCLSLMKRNKRLL